MKTTIKVGNRMMGGAALGYALHALSLGLGILFLYHTPLSMSIWTLLSIPVSLVVISDGVLAVYRLFRYFRGHLRAELRFDGTTVTVTRHGNTQQSFTRRQVQTFYPHRNEVHLVDGTVVRLPSHHPYLDYYKPEVWAPWLSVWWPQLDLSIMLLNPGLSPLWSRYVPAVFQAIGLALFLTACSLWEGQAALFIFSLSYSYTLMVIAPYAWERKLRRDIKVSGDLGGAAGAGVSLQDKISPVAASER